MKRITICILIIITALAISCQSKKKNAVLYHSPVTIAMRLNEIDMALSDESMTKLTNFFERNDSLAQLALTQGKSLEEISKWYYPTVDSLASLLPPLERNDFILADKGKSGIQNYRPFTSELRRYVLYREKLALTSKQIESLLVQCDSIELLAINKDTKAEELEKNVLTTSLDSKQIKEYYIQKNEPIAEREAKELLKQMKKNDLYTVATDSANIYQQVYAYKLEQKANWEYLRYTGATSDSVKQDEARLWAYRPLPIIRLETCQPSSSNKMLDITCKREKLGLAENMTESLLTSYSQLLQEEYKHKYKVSHSNEKYNRREQENKSICRIIPSSLLEKYFRIIIYDNVKKQVEKDWDILLDYDLVNSTDSSKVIKELTDYETRLAVANQWISVEKSRKNQFTKSDIINGKPQLLKQLDIEKQKRKNKKIVKF